MHLNMCIPHLFNEHSLALIIYDNTLEETNKHSVVDSTKVRKPLLQETTSWSPAWNPLLGHGLKPQPAEELQGARNRANEDTEIVFD